ncbi:phage baseplate assembly protein [Aliamphritea ceti]|uniref:phage baseplate assembly protein n=1 Tax=Aliamphritea ceti TaxID=1524258 RepID=UPI0021C42EF2|nr:hypothetical protein [Aliamphritea ceti]
MSNIKLHVNGYIYEGWKDVSVTRSIEEAAPKFTIGLSADFQNGTGVLPVQPGAACKLVLNNTVVITGYVDGITGSYDDKTHSYSITGRSAIGDLVDCSAIVKGGEFNNLTVTQIAESLCEPFGVKVRAETSVGERLAKHRTDDASPHSIIERACRRRGLILSSSPAGELIITTIGNRKVSTPLQTGGNVKKAGGSFSMNQRFNQYLIKGQSDSSSDLASQIQAKGVATDPGVKRYRPLVVDAEDGETDLQSRAQFEATVRLGRSNKITYTVQGWEHDAGLWEPNTLVRVVDSYFGIDAWLLISTVVYGYSDGDGTIATITVMPKESFKVQLLKEKSPNAAGGGKKFGNVFADDQQLPAPDLPAIF